MGKHTKKKTNKTFRALFPDTERGLLNEICRSSKGSFVVLLLLLAFLVLLNAAILILIYTINGENYEGIIYVLSETNIVICLVGVFGFVFCKTFIHKIAEEKYTILQPEIIL